VKKTEAAEAARQKRKIWLAGRESKSAARDRQTATGSNRVVLGPTHKGVAERVGDEEEMANVDEEQDAAEEKSDVMMAETETATRTATDTETETEQGALATNHQSDPAQLRKVIRMNHSGAGDGSRTQGGRSVFARATKKLMRYWDQPFGI